MKSIKFNNGSEIVFSNFDEGSSDTFQSLSNYPKIETEENNMQYTIKYDDSNDTYLMDGTPAEWIGGHLVSIANLHAVVANAVSETQLIAILAEHGIEVQLLDSDGSKLDY